MSTVAASGSRFTPASNQWLTKKWALPVGTTKIKFRSNSGFGNDFFLDSVRILGGSAFTQVNIKVAPEGFYNGTTLNMKDIVNVYLRNAVSPFAKVDSSKVILDNLTLTAPAVFMNAASGTYYFQIEHRNSIETWSKAGGESFTRGVFMSYDFTTAQSQTYGSNAVLNYSKYLMFSGDVNKDGVIDASDMSDVDNDVTNSVFGYNGTDLNGDDATDASDLSIVDNNVLNSVTKVTPGTSPSDIMNLKSGMKIRNNEYIKKFSGK